MSTFLPNASLIASRISGFSITSFTSTSEPFSFASKSERALLQSKSAVAMALVISFFHFSTSSVKSSSSNSSGILNAFSFAAAISGSSFLAPSKSPACLSSTYFSRSLSSSTPSLSSRSTAFLSAFVSRSSCLSKIVASFLALSFKMPINTLSAAFFSVSVFAVLCASLPRCSAKLDASSACFLFSMLRPAAA